MILCIVAVGLNLNLMKPELGLELSSPVPLG